MCVCFRFVVAGSEKKTSCRVKKICLFCVSREKKNPTGREKKSFSFGGRAGRRTPVGEEEPRLLEPDFTLSWGVNSW